MDLKKFFQAINVSRDAQEIKLGVGLHVFAEQVTSKLTEPVESSTVAPINLLTASNVSVSRVSKELIQFAETSPVQEMKFSTESIVSALKDFKELTTCAKSFNVQPTHSGMEWNVDATKDLLKSERAVSSNVPKTHTSVKLVRASAKADS